MHLQWVFSPHSQCTDHESEQHSLAKMVTLNFKQHVFETTLRYNSGKHGDFEFRGSSNCPLCFCRLVRLRQIALVKDLSQELTNSGDGSWMFRSEGNSTRSSFWMNIDTSFVVNSCKRGFSLFIFSSWQLLTFQILTNPAPLAIKHQLCDLKLPTRG